MAGKDIVEMEEGSDGTFHNIVAVKKNPSPHHNNYMQTHVSRRMSALYEFIDGFTMGLGAIENFVVNMRKLNKKARREGI